MAYLTLNDKISRLRENNISYLDLEHENIGDERAKAIADALKSNNSLIELCLQDNKICDEGAKAIADALKTNTSITYLNLCNIQIGDDGAKAIADALKSNTTLTKLWLNNNQIGDEGAKAIANALKSNTSLKELSLWFNKIGDEGAKAFIIALTDRRTSAFLHLRNNFGAWSATVLADALGKYNSTLESLALYRNGGIGKELIGQIKDLLVRNRTQEPRPGKRKRVT